MSPSEAFGHDTAASHSLAAGSRLLSRTSTPSMSNAKPMGPGRCSYREAVEKCFTNRPRRRPVAQRAAPCNNNIRCPFQYKVQTCLNKRIRSTMEWCRDQSTDAIASEWGPTPLLNNRPDDHWSTMLELHNSMYIDIVDDHINELGATQDLFPAPSHGVSLSSALEVISFVDRKHVCSRVQENCSCLPALCTTKQESTVVISENRCSVCTDPRLAAKCD